MSLYAQPLLDTHDEMIIDLFAGGGGASSGIEQALGRQVDIAINHDKAAVALHAANHPQTEHHATDVFEIDPRIVTKGRPVGFLWASPDCTYHSKARGGKPIRSATRKRRALAWVVTRWAGTVRPRVIMLENVEEFAQWGPLVGKPDALRPCPKRRGQSFKKWVKSLTDLGYVVEHRELRACDYGAPTIRKRLFLIARCDGQPIVWPEATHGPTRKLPYRTAAECIDWTIPMLSIFATKDEAKAWGKGHGQSSPIRPLAENTNRRIARGVKRYVLDNPKPFLVRTDMTSAVLRNGVHNIDEPVRTQTTGGSFAVVSPTIAGVGGRAGQSPERSTAQPLGTITAKGDAAVVAPIASGHPIDLICAACSPELAKVMRYAHDAGLLSIVSVSEIEWVIHIAGRPNDIRVSRKSSTVAPFAATISHGEESESGKRWGQGVRSLEDPNATQSCSNDTAVIAPIIAPVTHEGDRRTPSANEPLATITTANRGELGIVAPYLVPRYGEREGQEPRSRSVEDPAPVIVPDGNGGSLVAAHITKFRTGSTGGELDNPLDTVTANSSETSHPGGATPLGIVAANISSYYGPKGENDPRSAGLTAPLPTQPTENRHAVVASFLAQNNEGFYTGDGRALDDAAPTVCANGSTQSLIAANMVQSNYGEKPFSGVDEPVRTVVAGGTHHGVVASHIQRDFGQSTGSATDEPIGSVTGGGGGHAGLVASFLAKYYGHGVGQKVDEPAHTIPTVDRFGFVTVTIDGQTYFIEDIAMRMLQPRELYSAQGFRQGYVIDRAADGRKLTKTEQVRMCGNSVCPPVAEALARANCRDLIARKELRSA